MRNLMVRFWKNKPWCSTEFLFLTSILALGILAGLVLVRDAVVAQLKDLGNSITCVSIMDEDQILEDVAKVTNDSPPVSDTHGTETASDRVPGQVETESYP